MNWQLELPYPLSINKRIKLQYVSRDSSGWSRASVAYARERLRYRESVFFLFKKSMLPKWGNSLLNVNIKIYCPDKRHRDSDGVIKELFDAMEEVKIYEDDYQIKSYTVERMDEVVKNGKIVITIEES